MDDAHETQRERARRILTETASGSIPAFVAGQRPLSCCGQQFRPMIGQFNDQDEGLGRALFDGAMYRATLRLGLEWEGGAASIPVFVPWADEFDRFGWGGRPRVFVRQLRHAPGPQKLQHHAVAVPPDRKRIPEESPQPRKLKHDFRFIQIRPIKGPVLSLCVDLIEGSRHARIGQTLGLSDVKPTKKAKVLPFARRTADDLWSYYLAEIEPHSDLHYISALGRLRTNRFLGLADEEGDDERLNRAQIDALFHWDGHTPGRLPLDDPRHLANYRVREFRDFLFEQTSRLIAHLRQRCADIQEAVQDGEEDAALADSLDVMARKLLSQEVMYWFERAAKREGQFQLLDDLNPLTARAHTRRVTFMGKGGPGESKSPRIPEHNEHNSDLGRLCPVDTPQGERIGLNVYLAQGAGVNGLGLITAPLWTRDGQVYHLDVFAQVGTVVQVASELSKHPVPCLVTDERGHMQFGVQQPSHLLRPTDVVSECTATIPFLQHNDNNRALMGTNFVKQAIALPAGETPQVFNANVPQPAPPPFPAGWPSEELASFATYHGTPYPPGNPPEFSLGRNLWVAVMPWFGWNFEDGIVVSRELAESGLLTHTELHMYQRDFGLLRHEFPTTRSGDDDRFDPNGVVKEGVVVEPGDVLTAFGERAATGGGIQVKRVRTPYGVYGRVSAVRVLRRSDGYRLREGIDVRLLIWIQQEWPLEVGDKLANRHGGKGVVCRIEDTHRMPTFKVGQQLVRAQVIVNPFGILGRKNLGQLAETACAMLPGPVGTNLFGSSGPQDIRSLLESHGLSETASVEFVDPTGLSRRFDNVAVGRQFFMKLDHSPHKKLHCRGIGPNYSLITGQPVRGRRHRGGQCLGEMEIWALIAHEAFNTYLDLGSAHSDPTKPQSRTSKQTLSTLRSFDPMQQPYSSTLYALWCYFLAVGLKFELLDQTGNAITWNDLEAGCAPVIASFRLSPLPLDDFNSFGPTLLTEPLREDWQGGKDLERGKKEVLASDRPNHFHKSLLPTKTKKKDGSEKIEIRDVWGKIDLTGLKIHHPLFPEDTDAGRSAIPLKFLPVIPWRFRCSDEDLERTLRTQRPSNPINRCYEAILRHVREYKNSAQEDNTDYQERIQAAIDRLFGVDGTSRQNRGDSRWPGLLATLVGKPGFIRRHCLRRRVDCSARATITVDPTLPPDQVRIPIEAALALLEPILPERLLDVARQPVPLAHDDREQLCERVNGFLALQDPPRHLLLNRQPSLHRLNMQAFRFQAWRGRTIQIPPYCTAGLGADFDGDTVAIYLPISAGAQRELRERLSPLAQVLSPGRGDCAWALGAEIGWALERSGVDLKSELESVAHDPDAASRATMQALPKWQEALGASPLSFGFSAIAQAESAEAAQQNRAVVPFLKGKTRRSVKEIFSTGGMPEQSMLARGRTALDFFAAESSARAGLKEKAFTTRPAGYLTRQLVYLMSDIVIVSQDCGDQKGLNVCVGELQERGLVGDEHDLLMLVGGMIGVEGGIIDLLPKGEFLSQYRIRTPLTCKADRGVCATCYGRDLAGTALPHSGCPVGIIAAQSIGERGTQLAMKTFHSALERGMEQSIELMQRVVWSTRQALSDDPPSDVVSPVDALAKLVFGVYSGSVHMKHFALMLRALRWEEKPEGIEQYLQDQGLWWLGISFERQLEAIAECVRTGAVAKLWTGLDWTGFIRPVTREYRAREEGHGKA